MIAPVDWPRLIWDLRQSGVNCVKIGDGSDIDPSLISMYLNKKANPSHSRGENLINFWAEELGRAKSAVPRIA